jgi:hypothetical protein
MLPLIVVVLQVFREDHDISMGHFTMSIHMAIGGVHLKVIQLILGFVLLNIMVLTFIEVH